MVIIFNPFSANQIHSNSKDLFAEKDQGQKKPF